MGFIWLALQSTGAVRTARDVIPGEMGPWRLLRGCFGHTKLWWLILCQLDWAIGSTMLSYGSSSWLLTADSLALWFLKLYSRGVSKGFLVFQPSHVVVERGFGAKQALVQNYKCANFSVTLNWFRNLLWADVPIVCEVRLADGACTVTRGLRDSVQSPAMPGPEFLCQFHIFKRCKMNKPRAHWRTIHTENTVVSLPLPLKRKHCLESKWKSPNTLILGIALKMIDFRHETQNILQIFV